MAWDDASRKQRFRETSDSGIADHPPIAPSFRVMGTPSLASPKKGRVVRGDAAARRHASEPHALEP